MTKWQSLGIGRNTTGRGNLPHATSRFDPLTKVAMERVVERERITMSSLIYTAVLRLPEVRDEIATIKREKRGESDNTSADRR